MCEHRPNTVFHHCVSGYNECLPSCMGPEADSDRCFQTLDCVSRCLCRDGFISEWPNGGGRCIRKEECAEKVGKNKFLEFLNDFLKLCDDDPLTMPNKCIDLRQCLPTCQNPVPDKARCDYDQQECSKQPLPRCVCRPGFVSESASGDGPCIKLEQCPTVGDEKFVDEEAGKKRRRVMPTPPSNELTSSSAVELPLPLPHSSEK